MPESKTPARRKPAKVVMTPMTLMQQAISAGIDNVGALEQLMALQERSERNEAARQFAANLAAFQGECPAIRKAKDVNLGRGGGYSYATLEDIMRDIQPLLAKHGLSVTFSGGHITDVGMMSTDCIVRCGIHTERTTMTLPVPAQMSVNDTQKMAAAFSYARRYALIAALNIQVTDEDIDAQGLDQPQAPSTITEQQVVVINDILEDMPQENVDRFTNYLTEAGINTIDQIPASRFDYIKAALVKRAEQARKDSK